jgi:hypothetical protein
MMSSASTPSFCSIERRIASMISYTRVICWRRSGGAAGRLALYSAYSSRRNDGVRESIATAISAGLKSVISF